MGCPLYLLSKFKTDIALSTTEAEHIVLSHSMRYVLTLLTSLQEIHSSLGIESISKDNITKCTFFKTMMVVQNWQSALAQDLEPKTS